MSLSLNLMYRYYTKRKGILNKIIKITLKEQDII